MRAFAPISEATRYSIVKLNVDGATVALGTVVDTNGLALTKASELKKGKLTCWLAIDKEVEAEVIGTDEEEDVALVRVHAPGLKPIQWAAGEVSVGQWAITPGIAETPHAVGIISALPRRIRPPRALIGVQFEFSGSTPKIQELLPGLGAEKAGLKPGDLIVGMNHVTVTNREQVVETLREFREGQTVKLRVRREEKEFDTDVRMMVPRSGQLGAEVNPQQRQSRLTGEVSQRAEGFEQAIEHDSVIAPLAVRRPPGEPGRQSHRPQHRPCRPRHHLRPACPTGKADTRKPQTQAHISRQVKFFGGFCACFCIGPAALP